MTDAPERVYTVHDGGAPMEYLRKDLVFRMIEAEGARLREAGEALIGIVEGIDGAMNYGTWRSERTNLRMKDTEEWVIFYNAIRARQEGEG